MHKADNNRLTAAGMRFFNKCRRKHREERENGIR
jgi:hypothetical protein